MLPELSSSTCTQHGEIKTRIPNKMSSLNFVKYLMTTFRLVFYLQSWKSQRIKIHRLASGFSKEFSKPGLAYMDFFPKILVLVLQLIFGW
jgi:hypothetical protein